MRCGSGKRVKGLPQEVVACQDGDSDSWHKAVHGTPASLGIFLLSPPGEPRHCLSLSVTYVSFIVNQLRFVVAIAITRNAIYSIKLKHNLVINILHIFSNPLCVDFIG